MPSKQFQFHADARQSILRGASILADAVGVTLGPKSKCVLIERRFGRPIVCDDGVSIAKEAELKDPEQNLGAQGTTETALEIVEGLQFDRGYLSPYFVTDAEAMKAALDEAVILIHEKKITSSKDLLPLLEQVGTAKRVVIDEEAKCDGTNGRVWAF